MSDDDGEDKCSVENCNNVRNNILGISLHRFPGERTNFEGMDEHQTRLFNAWRRVLGMERRRIDRKTFVCTRHFSENQYELRGLGKIRLRPGAVPSQNLPRIIDADEQDVNPRLNLPGDVDPQENNGERDLNEQRNLQIIDADDQGVNPPLNLPGDVDPQENNGEQDLNERRNLEIIDENFRVELQAEQSNRRKQRYPRKLLRRSRMVQISPYVP